MHGFTLTVFTFIRVWETVDAHCGYNFPWSPFNKMPSWMGGADRHDFHHSKNMGNFGLFAFWDKMMGTDQHYEEWKAKRTATKKA
jgi:sterol desaturase/sphingolipid hydroxylase (fatty acid hydroxylase superfamily)